MRDIYSEPDYDYRPRQFATREAMEITHEAERRMFEMSSRVVDAQAFAHKAINLSHAIARRRGVKFSDIMGHTRKQDVAHARFQIWGILDAEKRRDGSKRFTTVSIGKIFNRDHTTILHGIRRAHELGLVEGTTECSN